MITYLLIFILKFGDCLLSTLKTKTMINGQDRLSNFLKALSAMIYMLAVSKVIVDKSIVAILVIGAAEFIGGEIGTFTYKYFDKKFGKDKPYQFTIRFRSLDVCEFIKMQLEEQGIKIYLNQNNKTLKAISLNRKNSKIIKDSIEDKFKSYSVNEFKEYQKSNLKQQI